MPAASKTPETETPAEALPENIDLPNPDRTDPEVKAEVSKRKSPKPAPSPDDWVPFVSTGDETASFDFAGFPAIRWGKKLAWRVPAIYRDNMLRHHFVQVGRVREANQEEIGLAVT
jgi:hypothetical protein